MVETPSQLQIQSYLMNFPHTLNTSQPNNIWMEEMFNKDPKSLIINKDRAYRQWLDLYTFLAGSSLVYLLPNKKEFQDITYVANLGIHLHHIQDDNIIILSNFTSEPRKGEELVGKQFFESMGYKTIISPFKFEGEADLKYLGGNNYIGGWGIRSQIETYEWLNKHPDLNINVIPVEMVDDYLYHLDCSIFPLTTSDCMVCTEMFTEQEIAHIERYTNIIDVEYDDAMGGITNSLRMSNLIINSSNISELKAHDEDYVFEKNKINNLEKICGKLGMEPVIINLSEFYKSGGMLSCLVMNLGRIDFLKPLT